MMKKNRQSGGVSVEWTLCTMIILLALFAPLGPVGGNQSLFLSFLDAVKEYYNDTSYVMSLP